MVNLTDLLKGASRDALLAKAIELLRRKKFPVFGWQEGNPWRTLVELVIELAGDTLRAIQLLGLGGFLDYATGPETPEGFGWIDLVLDQYYDTQRKPATFAVHKVRMVDAAGFGPHDVEAGITTFLGPGDLEFTALDSGTLPQDGEVTINAQARSPGAVYNVAVGSINRLGTDMPGVEVSNPAIGTTGTSLVAAGLNRETVAESRVRARARWARLGTGTTPEAYRSVLLDSGNDIRRVAVFENTPTPGKVTAYVASPSGPAPEAAFQKAKGDVEKFRPAAVQAFVNNSNPQVIPIIGTVYCKTGQTESAEGEVARLLLEYQSTLQLGEKLVRQQLVEEIMAPEGVKDLDLVHPPANVTPAVGHVIVLKILLTYVEAA